MAEQPTETQKYYRHAALRILEDIKEDEEEVSVDTQREALLYLAEALVDLAETLETPVGA